MPNIMLHQSPELKLSLEKSMEAEHAKRSLAFFDLETTGLGHECEIVQLAAVSGCNSINLYTVPRCRMQSRAAKTSTVAFIENICCFDGSLNCFVATLNCALNCFDGTLNCSDGTLHSTLNCSDGTLNCTLNCLHTTLNCFEGTLNCLHCTLNCFEGTLNCFTYNCTHHLTPAISTLSWRDLLHGNMYHYMKNFQEPGFSTTPPCVVCYQVPSKSLLVEVWHPARWHVEWLFLQS
ncbi:unnamed protein product [Boreogadus saida]